MKAAKTYSLDVDLIRTIEEQAHKQRKSQSEMADELLRRGLGEAPGRPSPARQRLDRFEEAVLAAIDSLTAWAGNLGPEERMHKNWAWPMHRIRKESGLYPSEALKGLRSLQRRGILVLLETVDNELHYGNVDAPMSDHWGRPQGGRLGSAQD